MHRPESSPDKLYVLEDVSRCRKGHDLTPANRCPNGQCRICKAAATKRYQESKPHGYAGSQARYRQANRDRENERKRTWLAANPGKNAEYSKRYRATNPNEAAAAKRRWHDSHPDAVRLRQLGRRNRSNLEWLSIIEGDPCSYCGAPMEEVDHITPVAKGGTNEWENYAPACGPCNRRKNATPLVHFLLKRAA